MFKSSRGWGILLLAIFLILWGVAQFDVINLSAGGLNVHKLLAGVGIAAGILLLLNK